MGRRRPGGGGLAIDGWLAVDKAAGMTSTRVVELVRRFTQAAKAGHGGTLDPFSEGLLPVALGRATKTSGMVLEGDKGYRCWLRFGAETDTGDPTGQVIASTGLTPREEDLRALLPRFTGEIDQVPPAHSAIHVGGVRAYTLARAGEAVEMPVRRVKIHRLALESFSGSMAVMDVRCGKGTYMRALARDIGRELGCLAHLTRLLRTATLGLSIEQAVSLDVIKEAAEQGRLAALLFPIDRVLADIPALRLGGEAWSRIVCGQAAWVAVPSAMEDGPACSEAALQMVRLYDPQGRFGALGELTSQTDAAGLRYCLPKRLFPAS